MLPSVMALFCEDIREEPGSVYTLIGIFPDNVNFVIGDDSATGTAPNRIVSRFAIFLRLNFDPKNPPEAGYISLLDPSGERMRLSEIDEKTIRESAQSAKDKGNIVAGIITRVGFAQFPLLNGMFRVELTLGSENYLAGALNVTIPSQPTVSG